MVVQQEGNDGGFFNLFNTREQFKGGDASIGSGFVNVTKKEQRIIDLNTYQTTDARDLSRSYVNTSTDARSFAYTNAPTLVLGSPSASVQGANTSVMPSTDVAPVYQTKKEQSTAQTAEQKASQDTGLDTNKLMFFAALIGVAYFVFGNKKKKND